MSMTSVKAVITMVFSTLLVSLSASAAGALYDGFVVFGDSMADSGNNAIIFDIAAAPLPSGTLRTPLPIPSPTFIPDFPYASNQYTNGATWPATFASMLGAYVGQDLSAGARPSLLGGSDFASGGARMGSGGSAFPVSVEDQLGAFLSGSGGVAPSNLLYVVQAGGNDARDALAVAAGGGDPTALIAGYVQDSVSVLAQLHAAGAVDILWINIPNIGLSPALRAGGPAAVLAGATIAGAMNGSLAAAIAALPPGALGNLHEFDFFQLINSIALNPAAFGFADTASACAYDLLCIADPSGTLFWDGVHPTAAAHQLLGRLAFQAAVPEPGTLILVALSVIGLATRITRFGVRQQHDR